MAPQLKERDDEDEYPLTLTLSLTSIDDDDDDDIFSVPTSTVVGKPYIPKPMSIISSLIVTTSDYPYGPRPNGPPLTARPNVPPPWAPSINTGLFPSSSEWITTTKATPLGYGVRSSQITQSPFLVSTVTETAHPYTSYGYGHGHGNGPPDWHRAKEKSHSGMIIAISTITSVVSLAAIGAIVFFCLRKRKRQREGSTNSQTKAQEMMMQNEPGPTARPYMAPLPTTAPSYAASSNHLMPPSNVSAPPPIILGPISSGTHGTGIDTSDVISMTSSSNFRQGPPNPFSDNDSLTEPPPPYRPRSAAPPSLTNSSRQSSIRASTAPPTTSRTQLIERSPFDDPDDDDAVSELSGPTVGNGEDAMSAVSDLSYQTDPIVNRTSI